MLRGLQCDLLQIYVPKVWLHFYSPFSHMRPASLTHPTVLYVKIRILRNTNPEAPHCTVSSTLLLPLPS